MVGDGWRGGGTYIEKQLPVKSAVDLQPGAEGPVGEQRLAQHGREEGHARVVVAHPGDLDAQLDPVALPRLRGGGFPRVAAVMVRIVDGVGAPRALDLGLDADNGLGAVGEADARAPVGAGQYVGLGDEGAELGGGAAVGADWRREGERRVEVGELGGGEEDVLGRRHFGRRPDRSGGIGRFNFQLLLH